MFGYKQDYLIEMIEIARNARMIETCTGIYAHSTIRSCVLLDDIKRLYSLPVPIIISQALFSERERIHSSMKITSIKIFAFNPRKIQ